MVGHIMRLSAYLYTSRHGIFFFRYQQAFDGRHRELVKTTFNALLNAKGMPDKIEDFDTAATGMSWKHFAAIVRHSLGPLSPYLLSSVGLQLQYMDAQIAERVLLHFAKMQVPCLSMHDSFIVMSHYQDELREVMTSAFTEVAGVAPKMKSSHSTLISDPRLQNGPHGTALHAGHYELDTSLARQRLQEFWDYSSLRANSSLS